MRLVSFHVRLFRNIIDSGEMKVDEAVTCLVGKNEAGKSALLEALHRLNPARPQAEFDLLDEYPRWLKKEHEITGQIEDVVPITATFEITGDEQQTLRDRFGPDALIGTHVQASRRYAGKLKIEPAVDRCGFINWFVANHIDGAVVKELGDLDTSEEELGKKLETLSLQTNDDGDPTQAAFAAKEAEKALKQILGDHPHATAAIHAQVNKWLPRTFYFSRYAQLRGRYSLGQVLSAVSDGDDDEEIETAADFLKLAHVSPENVDTWEFEESQSELEAVSSMLTQRVRRHWRQNEHLKLDVRIEDQPSGRNDLEIQRYLQFRVEDTRHDFSNRLDRRSTGFQWFVSFMASFFEFEQDKELILLLDEPGLSLHARAQMDLLDAIEGELASNRQVLYTTHSPFMVRTEALQRARIVEDQGPESGAVVTNQAVTRDRDTLFPLQAALGYDIAQNLFIGPHNVVVEGVSDFIYITAISARLASLGRRSLTPSCRLLPVGGATNIPTFVALLGNQLDIVVLLDGNSQRQRLDTQIERGLLDSDRVITLDDFTDITGADIEDLFAPTEYRKLYNATFGKNVKAADIKGSDRIVKRLERHRRSPFDHGHVAAHFLGNQTEFLADLSDSTLNRFEALIAAINQALPSEAV